MAPHLLKQHSVFGKILATSPVLLTAVEHGGIARVPFVRSAAIFDSTIR